MADTGTAVGPDLSMMAGMATIHSMVATIRMTMTNTVLSVKTAEGVLPAVLKQKQGINCTAQEYADLIAFLQWAATGSQKEVKASEIGELQ
jgi:hypothetical protein